MPTDFYYIRDNINLILGYPNRIYQNLPEKKGSYLFVKNIKVKTYAIVVEIINTGELEVISAFTTGEKYLEKFTLLWS